MRHDRGEQVLEPANHRARNLALGDIQRSPNSFINYHEWSTAEGIDQQTVIFTELAKTDLTAEYRKHMSVKHESIALIA